MTSETPAPLLTEALAAGSLVLDGGMSNQLESAGHDLSDELWSARLLAEVPEAITQAHLAYFLAGADVAITSSYQATYEGFAKRGIERERASELLVQSVELAREAARRAQAADALGTRPGAGTGTAPRPLYVAASIGPYGAMLADGSEYRGRYGLTVPELAAFHRPRIETLAAAAPDVLALETVPDTDEAKALLEVVRGLGTPAWLSYSVEGDRTRAGQPLEEAFALAADVDEIIAVGVNCCAPGDATRAVEIAARVTGKPVVVYPNSGEGWDANARTWTGSSSFAPEEVEGWSAAGARLIGGCCRVGPEAIASIAKTLAAAAR
ncbi:homocysteine S-methyltransferase [Streptomyces acidiscabies]|uniref:S-methylmethionine:homocysteine methyltransferase n=1 Tax=Streptomyces acidiscabies TaxID=42234 RepID=A0AAP6B8W5_9ACTN|nr:homocysteine S-methyltransferase [Streptomyces acidiscabies]MBP5936117.1 homocysteine S-methyltransferase [Streptomyces sp. LBUM 1476]MBZ3915951.1 homocysteine S-methyltransferase [Streptomyces acidiscabies]MDX2960344.1 homocysteine S-methyltransferase [Streptomyces acidiscabies]MDX3023768.1 homocysteine S-methyltransferase [Streptomyces acidiscabies]MDX3793985.1 homocysteine S-methyltransferase [Streptomyces acidiscabies]